jgi:hypothetical protein
MDRTKVTKKKSKKPLIVLFGFMVFFAIFIYLITRPSLQNEVNEKIELCTNKDDVKQLYERYKFDLIETDEFGNKIVSLEFQNAVRKKLESFNLSEQDLLECLTWIPPTNNNLNVIIIPDLSRRIIDSTNNPEQIQKDLYVLKEIWLSFKEITKLKRDSKDQLIIEVTDKEQALGKFSQIADDLQFDLSVHKGKTNRLFFVPKLDVQFDQAVQKMYQLASKNPLGADYFMYFRRELAQRIKKPTLWDNYENKIIIITDGYLEAENKAPYTKIKENWPVKFDYLDALHKGVDLGNVLDVITLNGLNIKAIKNLDLSNCELLICEVNERRFQTNNSTIPSVGKEYDFDILEAYWTDWFRRMGAKEDNIKFEPSRQANSDTKRLIREFFNLK